MILELECKNVFLLLDFFNAQKVKAEKQDESIDVVEDIENLTFWSSSKILLKNKGKFLKSFTIQYRLKPFYWTVAVKIEFLQVAAACNIFCKSVVLIDHSLKSISKFSYFLHWEWLWMHLSRLDWWILGQKLLKWDFKLMLQQLL